MTNLHLVDNLFDANIAMEPIRSGFGKGLVKAGQLDERVVALCADLTDSTKISLFAKEFPDRYIEVGIAEQNMAVVGAGLAAMGKIPFISSYAAFSPGRNWEQIKTSACINDRPVKIVGSHAGLYTGADGATHQMLEDIALMRTLPNMTVIVPGDSVEAEKATVAIAGTGSPAYLRLARDGSAVMTTADTPFDIGAAYIYALGDDITLVATGTMTYQAVMASEILFKRGIDAEVVHVPTIKPLDADTILKSARKTGHVLVVEEGQINGGLGSAVAELLGEKLPTPLLRMGIKDRFGQSGQPAELIEYYGLSAKHIALQAHDLLDCKQHNHKH